MRRTNTLIVIAFALLAMATVSCDKSRLGRDTGLNAGKGVGMMFRTSSSTSFSETKAVGAPVLNNIYGNEDDGFVIEEYVSDIEDVMRTPETKGTEIKQTTASSGNFNVANRQFQVMAFLDTTKTTSPGVEETYHINEFNYPAKYDGSKWNWVLGDDDAPCWRTSTKYSIWSYWPVDSEVTTGSRSAVSVPNWTSGTYNTVSFTHTVPKALEDQQDLLFAYNEETRDFAHIDGDEKKKYVYEDKEQTWIDNEGNDTQIFDNTNGNPKTRNIDIHFYHALAAVKFELNTSVTGADVHSITLCYTDKTTKNIITSDGIATTGSCTATGNPASTGDKVTFAWTNQGTKKPLHYEFDSSRSVAGGYTKTGEGVLFMIPQTLSSTSTSDIKIIVEFSKNGSTKYYTKVQTLNNVTWEAGKYYTYRLSIGEFHVPGENYPELLDVDINGLKNSGDNIQPSSALNIKGVTKMGLVINSWSLGSKSGQTVYLNAVIDGDSQVAYKTVDKVTSPDESNTNFSVNFEPVSESAQPGTNGKIYTFGTDNAEETYHKFYSFSPPTGSGKSDMGTPNIGPFYYVFDTTGASTFKIMFTPAAGDNSGGFFADVRCLIVLEVAKDPNLPGNFNTIDWSTI